MLKGKILFLTFIFLPFYYPMSYHIELTKMVFLFLFSFFMFICLAQNKFNLIFNSYNKNDFLIFILLLTIVFLNVFMVGDNKALSNYIFLLAFFFCLIFFPLLFDIDVFNDKYLITLLSYLIYVISFSIFTDYLILNFFGKEHQLLFNPLDKSYFSRPLGIFGQPSINSTLMVFYLSVLSTRRKISLKLLIISTTAILVQQSGVGFVVFILFLFFYFRNFFIFNYSKLIIIFFLLLLFILLINYNFLEKLNSSYISSFFEQFIHSIHKYWQESDLSIMKFLFGGVAHGVDFTLLFTIGSIGVVLTIFSLYFLFSYIKNIPSNHRFPIYILIAGTLHYPAAFYLINAFILPFITRSLQNK